MSATRRRYRICQPFVIGFVGLTPLTDKITSSSIAIINYSSCPTPFRLALRTQLTRSTLETVPHICRSARGRSQPAGPQDGRPTIRRWAPLSVAAGGRVGISEGGVHAAVDLAPAVALRGSGDVIAAIRVVRDALLRQSASTCSPFPLSSCSARLALSRPRSAAPALPGRSPGRRRGGGMASLLVTGSRRR